MRLGFRGRLIVGSTMLGVGFVAAAVVVLSVHIEKFAVQQRDRDLMSGVRSLDAHLDQQRAALVDETRFLARSPLLMAMAAIPGVDQATFEDAFDEIQGAFTADLAAFLDARGRVVAARGDAWRRGDELGHLAGLEAARRGQAAGQIWPHGSSLALVGVAPVIQGDVLLGILVRGERLTDAAAARMRVITGRDVLILRDGRVIAQSSSSQGLRGEESRVLDSLRNDRLDPAGHEFEFRVAGQDCIGLARPLPGGIGVIVLSYELSAIVGLYDQARTWLIGVGGLIALLGFVLASRLARRMSGPLHELTVASQRVASGQLDARVLVSGDDEVGRLGNSFNKMSRTIQALVHEVTEKAARAEAANRAKDDFLTTVSHELRTPLTGIRSTAELLAQFGDEASDAERGEFMSVILREAERLERRIVDTLDSASLAANTTEWVIGKVDLVQVCQDAIARLHSLQDLKAIEFRLTAGCDSAALRGDRERLTQAVHHLLHNAWVWSPDGGGVDVTVQSVGDGWEIVVADRGPGISAADQERIFEPFTQGEHSLVDKPQGQGLGLANAREVARAHGGGVVYRPREHGGAVFVMSLRAAGRPIDTGAYATASSSAGLGSATD